MFIFLFLTSKSWKFSRGKKYTYTLDDDIPIFHKLNDMEQTLVKVQTK